MKKDTTNRVAAIVLAVITLLVLGIAVAWNEFIYGDWRCAFAHCWIEKGDK